ncbi:methyltransferase family protein [Shimia isoporae]|uniref:Methyltransferase family protein n=1 Tax=Shimia isoporae TaxID=647720 RepID=A0A4R1NMI2_9RHOB|nr:class I SAM-dependent methyltransferase [Shimia isoporae]TCL09627.1 methyltransferase family protein [Shimia isoporae]
MDWDNFFLVHKDLPREGPGHPDEVAWACALAGVPDGARILDAGGGPGGDVQALLTAAPHGRILTVDTHEGFTEQAMTRFAEDVRVTAITGNMMAQDGPFDFIWCAGALYFVGIEGGLAGWRSKLTESGTVAFSEPCSFDGDKARAAAMFEDYPVGTEADIRARVETAGFEVLGTRKVSDAAWEAYYGPMDKRVAMLRDGADAALSAVLDEAEAEARTWRENRESCGYLLCVTRPI